MDKTNENELIFTHISSGNIFCADYDNLQHNNSIDFRRKNIAVLYAPNGVGKTSLANVLNSHVGSSFAVKYNGKEYSNKDQTGTLFHVIADQNSRNIISGKAEEYILGDNIRQEAELESHIESISTDLLKSARQLLRYYGITKKDSKMVKYFEPTLQDTVKGLVKRGTQSSDLKKFVFAIDEHHRTACLPNLDLVLVERFVKDIESSDSVLTLFLNLDLSSVTKTTNVRQLGETNDAVWMLNKYANRDECIVCETPIEYEKLLQRRKENRKKILKKLDEGIRKQIEAIESLQESNDYMMIRKAVESYFDTLDETTIEECRKNIETFGKNIASIILAELGQLVSDTSIMDDIKRLDELQTTRPQLTQDDELFIKNVVEESMGKELSVERKEGDKRITITINNDEFIGKNRNKLALSAGEQNFLSLAFEMLRAKNAPAEIVVLDDPISSFDSIFKYKIVYSILSSLRNKKLMLLTHSIDLVRLMQCQMGECFNLYIFNNQDGGENGFISIRSDEVNLIINLHELTSFLRNIRSKNIIMDEKRFLIAMVPFMRGYAHLIGSDIYDSLSDVMHGNGVAKIDADKCYNTLFGNEIQSNNQCKKKSLEGTFMVSSDDIVKLEPSEEPIIDRQKYPLLDKTLRNSIDYLRLRLLVEKKLLKQFNLSAKKCNTTNDIINFSYPANGNHQCVINRVRLMSKKSILNEFNHFEGNLSIFQPAIDISDQMLKKEKQQIEDFFSGESWKQR